MGLASSFASDILRSICAPKRNVMYSKYNTNDIRWQACLPIGDELSVKCNNENSKAKVAIGCTEKGVLNDRQCPQSRPVHGSVCGRSLPGVRVNGKD